MSLLRVFLCSRSNVHSSIGQSGSQIHMIGVCSTQPTLNKKSCFICHPSSLCVCISTFFSMAGQTCLFGVKKLPQRHTGTLRSSSHQITANFLLADHLTCCSFFFTHSICSWLAAVNSLCNVPPQASLFKQLCGNNFCRDDSLNIPFCITFLGRAPSNI